MQAQLDSSTLKILVVDDSAENRWLFQTQLQFEGYQVLHASSGREGIDVANQEIPDLILLDVMMPEMNGFEVCLALKQNPSTMNIPVIMITALRDVQFRIRGIEAGADEFLSRPHNREELMVRVQALIQLKRAREHLEEERNRLQLLYNISRAVTSQLQIEQMMSNIIAQTRGAVEASKGSVMLFNESGRVTHRILVRVGLDPEIADRVTEAVLRDGLAGWLIRHNRGTIISDTQKDDRWLVLPGDDENPVRSVIGVPLSRANRIVGVLFLMHPQPDYFTPAHLSLLETIGSQITTTIENAFLFAEIDEERRKLSAILAQSNDVIITTDELWRVSLLNQAAEQLLGIKSEQVVGKSLRWVPELNMLIPLFVRANDRPVSQEVVLNSEKILSASVSPIHEVGFVAVLHDITELRRVEELKLAQERREKELVKATFARYMSPRLVEHVLSNEPGLLARQERQLAVVLFADLRDFTRMIVNISPNRAILILNEFFTDMTDIVYQFDGTIFDLTGDELMIGFNVPFNQPDAAYRAFLTGIHMQRHFNDLRQNWWLTDQVVLGLGIGIDQGEVVMGNVGAESRMTFRMVGEAVNIAHRLVDMAEDGQLIVTEAVHQTVVKHSPELLENHLFKVIGPLALKGKSTAQTLYQLQVPRTALKGL